MLRPQLLVFSRRLGCSAASRAGRVWLSQPRNAVPAVPAAARRGYSDSPTASSDSYDQSEGFRKLINGRIYSIVPKSQRVLLRDACRCSKCVDPHSGQKTFSTTDLPELLDIRSASLSDDGSLSVEWKNDVLSDHQTHMSVYPPEQLEQITGVPKRKRIHRVLWNRATLETHLDNSRISYDDWMAGGEKFWDAFAYLHKTGLVFVQGVPESETSVEEIGRKMGYLQDTFYGRTWDVVSKPSAENVAYTSRFLGLHQDLLYMRDPPRIQLLHCISNEAEGGESLFSDGVRAAMEMQLQYRSEEKILTRFPVNYHYNKNGHLYRGKHMVIRKNGSDFITKVWWSPPFQDDFTDSTPVAKWNKAAKVFQRILESEENMYEHKLNPGECVVFDNRRVLHGRRQFSAGQGKRWLKGTYVGDQAFKGTTELLMDKFSSHWRSTTIDELWADETKQVRRQLEGSANQASKVSVGEE